MNRLLSRLRDAYGNCWYFLKNDCRRPLLAAVLCLVGGVILGLVIGSVSPALINSYVDAFRQSVMEEGVVTEAGLSVAGLMANNWRVMLIAATSGIAPFLFLPGVVLVINGLMLGIMFRWTASQGIGIGLYLLGILPHGIFEIGAMVIATGCGIALCHNMCHVVTGSPKKKPLTEMMMDLLWVLLLIIAPLTLLAALIEARITPVLMGLFL